MWFLKLNLPRGKDLFADVFFGIQAQRTIIMAKFFKPVTGQVSRLDWNFSQKSRVTQKCNGLFEDFTQQKVGDLETVCLQICEYHHLLWAFRSTTSFILLISLHHTIYFAHFASPHHFFCTFRSAKSFILYISLHHTLYFAHFAPPHHLFCSFRSSTPFILHISRIFLRGKGQFNTFKFFNWLNHFSLVSLETSFFKL